MLALERKSHLLKADIMTCNVPANILGQQKQRTMTHNVLLPMEIFISGL